jgi:hypothetical protein
VHRCREHLGDPSGGVGEAVARDAVGQSRRQVEERDELVTAEAGDQPGADGGGQPAGDGDEHLVAGPVAERVVDPLEVVEVHQDRHQRLAVGRTDQRRPDAVEPAAVRQAGEVVVPGGVLLTAQLGPEPVQLLLGRPRPPCVPDRGQRGQDHKAGAEHGGQRVHELALPGTARSSRRRPARDQRAVCDSKCGSTALCTCISILPPWSPVQASTRTYVRITA